MLGDILLIEEKHRLAAKTIVDHMLKKGNRRLITAISGESGSGKSELAHTIARLLRKEGIIAKLLHTDNYYKVHPLQRREWRSKHGIENVVGYDEYDWNAIFKNVSDFKNSRKSEMPCVDLVTEQVDRLITNFREVDMLILDGLYAIKTESVDVRVFIELTYLQTKEKHTKDARGKEVMDEVRWATLEQEHKMVQALKPKADLLVTMDYSVVEAKQISKKS
jgi:uridine kinase